MDNGIGVDLKIISIVGARPNFMKLGPLSKEIRKNNEEIIIHTGQHYDPEMSSLFFKDLKIPEPDYNLGIHGGSPVDQVSIMLKEIGKVLIKEKPDLTIVYGDCNTALSGALCSIENKIPVAHIEAGPRNNSILITEMLNRIVADRISTLLFCATKNNLRTLKKENHGKNAFFVGDLMLDAYKQNLPIALKNKKILSKYGLKPFNYCLMTCHRAENTDNKKRLQTIVDSIIDSGKKIILPLHPRTFKMLKQFDLLKELEHNDNICLTDPLGYLDIILLGHFSEKYITDSGGVQREAYFMNKPCVIIYDESGWTEIQKTGWQIVTGIDRKKIVKAINEFKVPNKKQPQIFGNGRSAEKVMKIISSYDFKDWDRTID